MKPMATRNKPEPPEAWWETALAAISMIFVIAGIIAVLVLLDAAWNEPEERCFETATIETNYCREQRTWN